MKNPQDLTSRTSGAIGLTLYIAACGALMLSFRLPAAMGVPLSLLSFIPVFYGAHEALHGSLVAWKGVDAKVAMAINELACAFGFALQGMNFRLLRPAHIWHHASGRYEEGYAPDIAGDRVTAMDRLHYYVTLLGLPAMQWQAAGFLSLAIPLKRLPFTGRIVFSADRSFIPRLVAQFLVLGFWIYAIKSGGLYRTAGYFFSMSAIWSLLQNVSHYGLKGVDPATDKICAHTYILPPLFRYLTFGSLSHLAHHVDMQKPGLLLHEFETLKRIENKLGLAIKAKYGIVEFLRDVLRQLHGPLPGSLLTTSWMETTGENRLSRDKYANTSFQKRKGRRWKN